MKRIKLIPSILMLMLCMGVLAMGIYAAGPTSNTITGTIEVSAANALIEIDVYKDSSSTGELIYQTGQIRNSTIISLDEEVFLFDLSQYDDNDALPQRTLVFKITNHSTKALGAYFLKEGTTVGENGADYVNIADTRTFENGAIELIFSDYTKVEGKTGDSVTISEVTITFAVKNLIDNDVIIDFSEIGLYLNIEHCKDELLSSYVYDEENASLVVNKRHAFREESGLRDYYNELIDETLLGKTVNNITINSAVGSIPEDAFCWYTGVESVTIQKGIVKIETEAFRELWVEKFYYEGTINDWVTIDKGRGWSDASTGGHELYTIENGVQTKAENVTISVNPLSSAFDFCNSLKSITFTNTVTSLPEAVVCWCYNLTSVTIPSSVTSFGASSFIDCRGLTTINFPSGITLTSEISLPGVYSDGQGNTYNGLLPAGTYGSITLTKS